MSRRGATVPDDSRPSLSEVYRTIPLPSGGTWIRRFLAVAGPAYLVSVGYMDPGNWATDLQGGSLYGYSLLWIILASNLMAILLQTLCARLGLATGRDLAQACRDYYKRPAAVALWLLCELAVIACDLAEVIGSAIALELLFHIPLVFGVLLTGFDVLVLLGLMHFGIRKIEALILTLVGTVAACFALEIFLAKPDMAAAFHGLVTPTLLRGDALLVALSILGATVMPHNLYLHSSLVQTRAHDRSSDGVRDAIRLNTIDTVVALCFAFFVNAAILVLAASVFHGSGRIVEDFADAPALLRPLLGGASATLFAVALLASGQSSTITGTLAGQIVMEGFVNIRISPWLRRLITRGLALIPAILIVSARGGQSTMNLMVLSQVALSMQLPFAIFPLVAFTSDRRRMHEFANPGWLRVTGYSVCFLVTTLNIKLLYDTIGAGWLAVGGLVVLLFSAWVRLYHSEPPPADRVLAQSFQ